LKNYLVQNPRLSLSQKIEQIKGIAAGVLHLHKERIVHRDLATRNILLDKSGIPKVADFGMSRILESENTRQTTSNIGPLKWMAPESIDKKVYSEKSDVWSFGILVFEILSNGESPHKDVPMIDAAILIRDTGAVPIIPPDTPGPIVDLLKCCWQYDPVKRPTFEEICSTLKQL